VWVTALNLLQGACDTTYKEQAQIRRVWVNFRREKTCRVPVYGADGHPLRQLHGVHQDHLLVPLVLLFPIAGKHVNRVGILKQNAKSGISRILGFELSQNLKIFNFA
jgi:hypothetical protein